MYKFAGAQQISTAKLPSFFQTLLNTVQSLRVNGSKLGTEYFTSLYVGVCKAYKIGLKDGQPSTHFLCTLHIPHIIPGRVRTGFRCFRVSSDMLLESTSFL